MHFLRQIHNKRLSIRTINKYLKCNRPNTFFFSSDNAEFAAGVKQSAKISFDDDIAPARRLKAITNVDKQNAINLEDRIGDVADSNIKIEGMYLFA